MIRSGLATVILVGLTAGAAAQWIAETQGGEFGGEAVHAATVTGHGYALTFRCKGNIREIFFTSPEPTDKDTARATNSLAPVLKIRVDGGDAIEFPARLRLDAPVSATATTTASTLDAEVLQAVSNARSRIAVAVLVQGKAIHEVAFSAAGSTRAANQLVRDCRIEGAAG